MCGEGKMKSNKPVTAAHLDEWLLNKAVISDGFPTALLYHNSPINLAGTSSIHGKNIHAVFKHIHLAIMMRSKCLNML